MGEGKTVAGDARAEVITKKTGPGGLFAACASKRRDEKKAGGKAAQDPEAGEGGGKQGIVKPRDTSAREGRSGLLDRGASKKGDGTVQGDEKVEDLAEECPNGPVSGGLGLILASWKPRGLTHALNVVSGTHARVNVEKVVPGGAADQSTIRIDKGDVLIAVDGAKVTSIEHARKLLGGDGGSTVTLVLGRNGYEFSCVLKRGGASEQDVFKPEVREWTKTVLSHSTQQETAAAMPPPASSSAEANSGPSTEQIQSLQEVMRLSASAGVGSSRGWGVGGGGLGRSGDGEGWETVANIADIAFRGKGAARRRRGGEVLTREETVKLFKAITAPRLHGVIAKQVTSRPAQTGLRRSDMISKTWSLVA